MPLKNFTGEPTLGVQAIPDAFSRAVLRLGFTVSFNWGEDLQAWFTNSIATALVTPGGNGIEWYQVKARFLTQFVGENGTVVLHLQSSQGQEPVLKFLREPPPK